MAEITSGRARRLLSVGSLTSTVGGSYLWQALKRPFQSNSRADEAMLAAHVRNAQRIVERSTELRGAFMKVVQLLSMRPDLLPTEALDVLSVVQASVPPMPWERVRDVLVRELGAPPEERFRSIEPQAFAAASLGQVHRAELPDGRPVAVKIQYPDVAETVRQDVKNVRALLRVFEGIWREVRGIDVDLREVADELEARLGEELDYRLEARNADEFRRLLADDPEVRIPRIHAERSTSRVLTMDLLDGYPLAEIAAPGVDQDIKDWLGEKLFRLTWRQLLEFGVLHADPHPGNYLVTHHPRLGLLDFGSVRRFEPPLRLAYLRLARAILARDDRAMGDALTTLGFVDADPAPVVAIVHLICEPLERDVATDPRRFDVVARGWEAGLLAEQHRLTRTPGHQVLLGRALAGLDGHLKTLGTVRNWHRLFREVVDAIHTDERRSA
jgi:predicted unusual protein kinase regulating ubiquinone biosynthesis (AarF/ABC1/UbiB family)